jgi:hypothetical protein
MSLAIASLEIADVPVADVPVADVPIADVPVADVPIADVPVADVPVAPDYSSLSRVTMKSDGGPHPPEVIELVNYLSFSMTHLSDHGQFLIELAKSPLIQINFQSTQLTLIRRSYNQHITVNAALFYITKYKGTSFNELITYYSGLELRRLFAIPGVCTELVWFMDSKDHFHYKISNAIKYNNVELVNSLITITGCDYALQFITKLCTDNIFEEVIQRIFIGIAISNVTIRGMLGYDKNIITGFLSTVQFGRIVCTRYILETLNITFISNYTSVGALFQANTVMGEALNFAAETGNMEMVIYLMPLTTHSEKYTNGNFTSLIRAAKKGYSKVVLYLLNSDANKVITNESVTDESIANENTAIISNGITNVITNDMVKANFRAAYTHNITRNLEIDHFIITGGLTAYAK